MKNQLDVIIQPSQLFNIDPATRFVNYIDDENIESQGVKIRCKFTDTVLEVKDMIRQNLGIKGDFYMLEV